MFDGTALVQALKQSGVTHAVWIPDSETGRWESAFRAEPQLKLLRVSREGEAMALAAGLMIGGQFPVVVIQCTGLFEAGDALRNIVHDLKLPLFLIIGLRGYYAQQKGSTFDTCPVYTEPILKAWQIRYRLLTDKNSIDDLIAAYRETRSTGKAGAVLVAE
jgi:sulfopyruvate decarboxylase TPP-binding subunit